MPSHSRPRPAALVALVTSLLAGAASAQDARSPDVRAPARELSAAFADVAREVSPSVVSLRVEQRAPRPGLALPGFPSGPPGPTQGNGSGVIIRPDGYILTNRHVVADAVRVEALLRDGRRFEATVVGTDPATDLAVVRVEAAGLPAAPFADSDRAAPGQWVLAVGSPFGLDLTVTAGVVSAIGRGLGANEIEDYIQTDASINPGNSGGPLVDLDGRVLGINTMIVGRASGIGFAVPSSLAAAVADQIIRHGRVTRSWVGVGFQELTPELSRELRVPDRRGALVTRVVADGPAAAAGLEPGDVIRRVAGVDVEESRDLMRQVVRHPVDADLELVVLRRGRARTLTIRTAERPGAEAPPTAPTRRAPTGLGLQMRPVDADVARQVPWAEGRGVVVTGVEPGSPASRAGLEPGDVIAQADGEQTTQVTHVLAAMRDGRALLLVHARNGSRFVVVRRR